MTRSPIEAARLAGDLSMLGVIREETQRALDETQRALDETRRALDEMQSALDETQSTLDETRQGLHATQQDLSAERRRAEQAEEDAIEQQRRADHNATRLDTLQRQHTCCKVLCTPSCAATCRGSAGTCSVSERSAEG